MISGLTGLLAVRMFLPGRAKSLAESRRKKLNLQFRDMLSSLTTVLDTGSNVSDAFLSVREDLRVQYDEDAYILQELNIIIAGSNNGLNIEDLIYDLGLRSGIDDIKDFAEVFKITYRKGGNFKEIIKNTNEIISEKIEINEDIETTIAGNKMEQKMMIAMPIILIGIIKMVSSDFADKFVSETGLVSTTIAIVMFVASYVIAKKIMDIKV